MKDPRTGKRQARLNPTDAWIVEDVPHLRIVDQDTWGTAKARQGQHRHAVQQSDIDNRLNLTHRRKFLLSGLLTCGVCGSGYSIVGKDRYGCANRRNRGTCTNGMTILRREIEERVLSGLKDRLLTPDLVRAFIAEFHAEMNRLNAEAEAR